jgi:TetR/AcrR family transcriptional regulator
VQGPRHQSKASRTREAILREAEQLFGEKGFAATRLEDVAQKVGIRRASIVYHFRNKRQLYGAVLAELVQDIYRPVARVLDGPGLLADRVEASVSAFVDFIAERPSAARILLREIADGSPENPPELLSYVAASFAPLILRVRVGRSEALRYPKADGWHIGSTILGTILFELTALTTLAPALGYDPRAPERVEALRAHVMRLARELLGEHSGVEE